MRSERVAAACARAGTTKLLSMIVPGTGYTHKRTG